MCSKKVEQACDQICNEHHYDEDKGGSQISQKIIHFISLVP